MAFLDSDIEFSPEGTSIQDVLILFGNDLTDELKESLVKNGLSNSNIGQSIRFDVNREGEGYRFVLTFDDYGTFLDEGVKGAGGARKTTSKFNTSNNKGKIWKQNAPTSRFKFTFKKPPLRGKDATQGIEQWSNERGLNKFAVQEAVFRQGIKPNHWFTDVVSQGVFNDLVDRLEKAGAKQMELDFVKILEDAK